MAQQTERTLWTGPESLDAERAYLLERASRQAEDSAAACLFLAFETKAQEKNSNWVDSMFGNGREDPKLPMHASGHPRAKFELIDSTAAAAGTQHERRVHVTAEAFFATSERSYAERWPWDRIYSIKYDQSDDAFAVLRSIERPISSADGKVRFYESQPRLVDNEGEINMVTEMILTGQEVIPQERLARGF